jgi:hypothetical protein
VWQGAKYSIERTGLAAVGDIKARLLGSELIQSPIEKPKLIADC